MIDSQNLTDILLKEARFFAQRMQFDDAAALMPDEKFARLLEMHPLPEPKEISSVFEEVFWASLLTEEGRPCRPRLLYAPRQECMRPAVHRLANPVPLTREALRKLAPVQGPLGYLTWDCVSGAAEVTGIQGREGGDPSNFIVTAPKNGALDVSWSCARLLALRAGRLDRLSQIALPGMHDALDMVRKLTGNFEPMFLGTTIRAVANTGHGGAFWILREGCLPDGVNIGYPIQRAEPMLREQRYEARSTWLESLGYLAGSDGAVLLDSCVRLLGFGAFIDISKDARDVTLFSSEGNATKTDAATLGGGRHRSAIEFCVRFAPAAAIVVSEDGRVSVTWADTPETPCFAPFSTLGIITDSLI
jgi:hypothetical protein